jgi:hypothetical protein
MVVAVGRVELILLRPVAAAAAAVVEPLVELDPQSLVQVDSQAYQLHPDLLVDKDRQVQQAPISPLITQNMAVAVVEDMMPQRLRQVVAEAFGVAQAVVVEVV